MTAPPATLARVLDRVAGRLRAAGIAAAPREARLLVGHALGIGARVLTADRGLGLGAAEMARLDALVRRRARREPMSHLLGRREFWSLEFRVSADVLDPRPDSETVVEAALDLVADRAAPIRLLDLGTGTGCLLLALLSELAGASGLGVDISPAAVALAGRNARLLGLDGRAAFRVGDWGGGLDAGFDLIVANPPYVRRAEIAALEPEIARFEPRIALDGGADGLDAFRTLAPHLARLLVRRGRAVVEIGVGQDVEVSRIFGENGLRVGAIRRDLGGRARCLVAGRAGELTDT